MPEKFWDDPSFTATVQYRSSGGAWNYKTYDYRDSGHMISINHPGWSKASSGDQGGPFYLHKQRTTVAASYADNPYYGGSIWPISPQTAYTLPAISAASDGSLDAKGTTAIARSLPTNPVAGLSQFLGELHEGVPKTFGQSLTKERSAYFKGLGSEYLNYQFGWVPFVSDIRKFAHAIKHHNEVINGYRKGSDRKITRRFAFPTTNDYVGGPSRFITPGAVTRMSGDGVVSISSIEECWFEGAFRYHVPVGESHLDKMRRFESYANKVLGLNLNPSLVWELTPWSWLVDWNSNIGDIIHNISYLGQDGLVMQYGYVMMHRKKMTSYVIERCVNALYPFGGCSMTTVDEYKQRRPATPYGFGLDPMGFSPKRIAILAALGLTKGGSPWQMRAE